MKDSTKFEIAELNKLLAKLKKRGSKRRAKPSSALRRKELPTKGAKAPAKH